MKVTLIASTNDEAGQHMAGETLEIDDALADQYIKNGWAYKVSVAPAEDVDVKKKATIAT